VCRCVRVCVCDDAREYESKCVRVYVFGCVCGRVRVNVSVCERDFVGKRLFEYSNVRV